MMQTHKNAMRRYRAFVLVVLWSLAGTYSARAVLALRVTEPAAAPVPRPAALRSRDLPEPGPGYGSHYVRL